MNILSEKNNLHIETLRRFEIGLTKLRFKIDGKLITSSTKELDCDDFLGSFLEVHGNEMNGNQTLLFIAQLLAEGSSTVSISRENGSIQNITVLITGFIATNATHYEWDEVSSPW